MLVSRGVLRDIPVVISLHLMEEYFSFWSISLLDQVGVNEAKYIIAKSV